MKHEVFALTPHQEGDAGILCFPLCKNAPRRAGWQRVRCPHCGAECWLRPEAREVLKREPDLRWACTECALKAGMGARR